MPMNSGFNGPKTAKAYHKYL